VSGRSASKTPVRVLIVEDQDIVRRGLATLLELDDRVEVVGEAADGAAADGAEALREIYRSRPEVALVDVRMPRMGGFEATRKIKEERWATRVLIVSAYDNIGFVSEAKRVGAEGYVLKLAPLREILQAVRGALEGEPQHP